MKRIQLRLALSLATIVALVAAACGWIAERHLRERELSVFSRSLEERARLVADLVADTSFRVEERAALQATAVRAARAAGARVTLIGADGTVLADSDRSSPSLVHMEPQDDRPEVAAALSGRIASAVREGAERDAPWLLLAVPARDGGVVRLAADLGPLRAAAASLRLWLVAAGTIATMAAFLSGSLLARASLRPLPELRRRLEALARGEIDPRASWSPPDALAGVATALQQVGEEMRRRIGALGAEREQLRAVLHGMVEGVLVVDRDGRVVLANPPLRELFEAWGEVGGRPTLEVIRRTEVEVALERAAVSPEPVVVELRAGADRDRFVQMHAVRFPSAGELLGAVAVFHDVTELRRLERVRREFVANVSHELKTPLTAIQGFAETLLADGLPPDQRGRYTEVILRHARRLSALIEDLLELSRIEGRQEPVARSEVAIAPLARSLIEDLGPRLAARRLEIRLVCGEEVQALTDRRALERVLVNLLDNAIKYTDPGGRIQIRVAADAERVRIDVSDNGIGIPEADLPRVFERFYRVDKARSRDLGGTGLGLAIGKHLVHAVGGQVFVESVENKGSTFSVVLPAS